MNHSTKKLKTHKYTVLILSLLFSIAGCVIILRLNIEDFQSDDALFYVCWLCILLLLLLIAACFDRQSQPYLYVYSRLISLTPRLLFVGFILSVFLVYIELDKIICLIIFAAITLSAVGVYLLNVYKCKNVTEERLKKSLLENLIVLSPQDREICNKYRKFYKWSTLALIVLTLGGGRFAADHKLAFTIFAAGVYVACICCYYRIYRVKYKSRGKRIIFFLIDSSIFWCLSVFAILLNCGVIKLSFKPVIDPMEYALLICFGLAPYAKLGSYVYFSDEHMKIREELSDKNLPIEEEL